MPEARARTSTSPLADPRFRLVIWVVVGVLGWVGLTLLGVALFVQTPRKAGFDLELILEAGRRVAAGASPYNPALVNGTAHIQAVDLFYSYPPPVAQAFAILARVPSAIVLVGLAAVAVSGAASVAMRLTRLLAPTVPVSEVVGPLLAILPFLYPFAVALLFGNLDALYPFAYGLLLLAALAPSFGAVLVGGAALALISVAKIHPALLGLWLLVRGIRDRRDRALPIAWWLLAVALAVTAGVLLASLLVGGAGPWLDYGSVLRAASGAGLVLQNNIGPAAQLALITGGGDAAARVLHVPVVLVALAISAFVAWRLPDTVESLGWAAVASLVILPVTWFHYPAAMIPFAVAGAVRARRPDRTRVLALIAASVVVAIASIALPVLVWAGVGLVLGAINASRPSRTELAPGP
jgi:hypothetical protein